MLAGSRSWLIFQPPGLFVCHQSLQVVAVRTETAEGILVEQAFDAASGADLIGATLGADGPTHLAVPATA